MVIFNIPWNICQAFLPVHPYFQLAEAWSGQGPGTNGTFNFAECEADFSFGEEYFHRIARVGTNLTQFRVLLCFPLER